MASLVVLAVSATGWLTGPDWLDSWVHATAAAM